MSKGILNDDGLILISDILYGGQVTNTIIYVIRMDSSTNNCIIHRKDSPVVDEILPVTEKNME